jgi:hypothetical protein
MFAFVEFGHQTRRSVSEFRGSCRVNFVRQRQKHINTGVVVQPPQHRKSFQ